MTELPSTNDYTDISIQEVGTAKQLENEPLETSFDNLISASFDGQCHRSATKLLPIAHDPKPVLNVIRIRGGYLHIGPGYDGVAATADGIIIRESARFAFSFVNPAPEELKARAQYLEEDWVNVVDSVWTNHYHLLALAIPRLYYAREHCKDAQIVIPAPRNPVHAPLSMLERMVGLTGFSEQVRRLPDGLYRVRNLYLIWPNYRQPPFIHFFSKTMMHLEAFAQNVSTSDQVCMPRRFFILRPHNPRLENKDGLSALEACLKRHEFASVQLENTSLEEQICMFRNATHVVAAHGAGLANIVFSASHLRILEINMDLDGHGFIRPWFLLIAVRKRMHYQYLNASAGQFTLARLDEAFERLMAQPKRQSNRLFGSFVDALGQTFHAVKRRFLG